MAQYPASAIYLCKLDLLLAVSREGDCEPSVRFVAGFSLALLSMDQGGREGEELYTH